jgi:peptide deformylase
MVAAMTAEGGIGLAAPQLGILKRVITVSVPVFDFRQKQVGTVKHTLINPEIIWTGGALTMGWEGCLSFPADEPGKFRQVLIPRYPRIKVRGYTLRWELVTIGAKNLVARALAHEIDHLNGRNLATYARLAKEVEDARAAEEMHKENLRSAQQQANEPTAAEARVVQELCTQGELDEALETAESFSHDPLMKTDDLRGN